MLAAIMTPAAKPSRMRWRAWEVCRRKRKTVAAPRAVIRAVKPVPPAAQRSACVTVKVPFSSHGGAGKGRPPLRMLTA